MTSRQEKLIENYIRKEVRRRLNEETKKDSEYVFKAFRQQLDIRPLKNIINTLESEGIPKLIIQKGFEKFMSDFF